MFQFHEFQLLLDYFLLSVFHGSLLVCLSSSSSFLTLFIHSFGEGCGGAHSIMRVCGGQRTICRDGSSPSVWASGANVDHQAWWQVPLPAEPSHWLSVFPPPPSRFFEHFVEFHWDFYVMFSKSIPWYSILTATVGIALHIHDLLCLLVSF